MLELIQQYGMLFLVGSWPNGPLGGFAATLILAVLGMLLSFPIAIVIGIARTGLLRARGSWRPSGSMPFVAFRWS